MFFIDAYGKVQQLPKVCTIDSKQRNIFIMREKYRIILQK